MKTIVANSYADPHYICSVVKVGGQTVRRSVSNLPATTDKRERRMKSVLDALAHSRNEMEPGDRLIFQVQSNVIKNWLEGRGDYKTVLADVQAARDIIDSLPGQIVITVDGNGFAKALRGKKTSEYTFDTSMD